MAKLLDLNVVEFFDNDRIQFKTPVSVTKEGIFSTTLPESAVQKLKEYGLSLKQNRIGREGYFENKTLEGLNQDIHSFVKDCISRQIIEDNLVIKYKVKTKVAYLVDTDGEIIPNGLWVKNHKDFEEQRVVWRNGNANFQSTGGFTPSLSVFALVYHKRVYSYKSGKTVTLYERYRPADSGRSQIDWLASQVNVVANDAWGSTTERDLENLSEIQATPEVADLFVKMIKLIDQTNELFQGLNNPENILALLASNTPKKLEF